MSTIQRRFAPSLILTCALTTMVSAPSYAQDSIDIGFSGDSLLSGSVAEPMAVVLVPPLVESTEPQPVREYTRPMGLLWVGPRYGFGGDSPLGEEQQENFQLFDIAALWRLPWGWWPRFSTWGVETRLIGSAGELAAAGDTSFMGTLVPALALSSRKDFVSLDFGLGLGFFSNYKFGVQDFGGPVQIVGTTGIGIKPFNKFRAGYRFQHFSDAGTYGPTSLGVDMHIFEVGYAF